MGAELPLLEQLSKQSTHLEQEHHASCSQA
jgi:hypothetical protein